MNDLLLEIGKNHRARSLVKSLGLPLPLPENLKRAKGPMEAFPLMEYAVAVSTIGVSQCSKTLAETLGQGGANSFLDGSGGLDAAFADASSRYSRPAKALEQLDKPRVDALVFDATQAREVGDLRQLYTFFSANLPKLARSGRVVILGTFDPQTSPEGCAIQGALDGFVRSLGKEIGRLGATANLIRIAASADGAESALGPVLTFLLSKRSAFVTDQVLNVDGRVPAATGYARTFGLDQKLAIVTGAARGIGAATAKRLSDEGAHVLLVDRPADATVLSQLARTLSGTPVLLDVTAPDATERLRAAIQDHHQRYPSNRGALVDVMVHNAGITRDKTLARMSPEAWDQVMAVNLAAIIKIQKGLNDLFADHARIVVLSSVSGIAGNVGQTNYGASKSALVTYVAALANELAPRKITVNAVAPGFIETRLTQAIPMAIRQVARRLSALSQGGLPEDVAEAITFFSSPGSHGMTGRTLRVCGGALVGA